MTDTNSTIGLFYGSSTCYTDMAGEKIAAAIDELMGRPTVERHNIANEPVIKAQFYNYLIFGIPTWDYGELQEDWEEIWPDLDELALQGKHVALYGLGDQRGYPEWFLDALGYLHDKLVERGAQPVGYWPSAGYEFENSKALTADGSRFVGLALDDESEFDKTPERIVHWAVQVLSEFGLRRDNN